MRSELPLSTLASGRVTSEDEQATPQVCLNLVCVCASEAAHMCLCTSLRLQVWLSSACLSLQCA